MLDIKRIRETPEEVLKSLQAKGVQADLGVIQGLDHKRRELITRVEALKQQRNEASREIGIRKKKGEEAQSQIAAVRTIGDEIGELDHALAQADAALHAALLMLPNTPHASVPVGTGEADNVFLRTEGEAQTFSFEPKPHWDLGEALDIMDFKRSARMTGSGFPMLTGAGARLSRGLIQFMLDVHTREHGYREMATPFLCNTEAMTGTGQLPKMADDMYRLPEDDLWLIPTAEVPLTNVYREEIMQEPLPVCLTGYTPCFRREAGAAGKDTRGLNRVHQFDKVELVKFADPASSYAELESLLGNAEAILKRLGLHYRVLELCSADLSFAAAKTYDIELWAPGQQAWLEVSSCSNFEDFQARRANIRFRNPEGRVSFVHTLNGSGVALPRLIVALIENGQQEDGSIALPQVLWPYLGGMQKIES